MFLVLVAKYSFTFNQKMFSWLKSQIVLLVLVTKNSLGFSYEMFSKSNYITLEKWIHSMLVNVSLMLYY